jgi:hypothetical protein
MGPRGAWCWLGLGVLAAACGADLGGSCPNDLPAACPTPAPSYATSVSFILGQACAAGCHEPGGAAADRPLVTYAEVYAQRSAVLNQAYSCTMPPAGSPQLTSAQRAQLFGWLVCHAPDN